MAHDIPNVPAEPRTKVGSRYAQRLRKEGRLPAVIYGHGQDPVSVTLDSKQFRDLYHENYHLMNLEVEGKTESCLVKDVQWDYLGDDVIHVDLTRVDLTEEVEVEVELVLKGRPAAMNQEGAVLNHPLAALTVKCAANNIPDQIIVDVSKLTLEDTLTVGDLSLPEGVAAVDDPEQLVAQIQIQEEIEEEAEEEAAEGEPEVIGREDEEEGEAAAEEA